MTAPHTQERRPVPDAARFQPRERPAPGRITWTTDPSGWAVLGWEDWDALAPESRRTVEFVPGVYVTVVRNGDGTWTLLNRHGIDSRALVGVRSAPRVPIDPASQR